MSLFRDMTDAQRLARVMFTVHRNHTTAAGLGRLVRTTKGKNKSGSVSASCIKKQIKRMCRKLRGRSELSLRIRDGGFWDEGV